jgi:HEAT repeats
MGFRRKRRIWLLLGFSLLALLLAALFEPNRIIIGIVRGEAFLDWRPTSYWREILLVDGQSGKVTEATVQIFKTPTAIPVLRECLDDPDRNVRWPATALLGRFVGRGISFTDRVFPSLKKALHDVDSEVRAHALHAVIEMGPNARSAVPDLIELLNDPEAQIRFYADIGLWEADANKAMEAAGWKDYHFPMWDFLAKFPSPPKEKVTKDAREVYSFQAAQEVTQFIVAVVDFTEEEIGQLSEKERCDLDIEGFANAMGGKFQNKGSVEQNGLKGYEYSIEAEGLGVKGEMQFRLFWQGRRLYKIFVTFDRNFLNPLAAECFLNSFRLDNAN